MKAELQDNLISRYPDQFKNLNYIECGDGWYDILNAACFLIKRHVDHQAKHKNKNIEFYWSQIKEKFGALRAYSYGSDDYIGGVISMAESMSTRVCEISGEKGKLRYKKLYDGKVINAWIKCLSDSNAEKEGYVDPLLYGE